VTTERTEYITVDEAGVRTGLSSVTIRRAVKSGALHYRATKGATKLLDAAEVAEWNRTRGEPKPIREEPQS
jgi:excisionase family DNA binding protein